MAPRAPRYTRFVVYEPGGPCPRVVCPEGHEVNATGWTRHGDGLLVCGGTRGQACGARLWVLVGCRTPDDAPALYYAHVSWDELAHLERQRWTAAQVMRYLNETPMPDATERAA